MNFVNIGFILSFLLTLMVFSYILGDNPLFRLAEHIFVGVSVGYAVLVAWYMVLQPTLLDTNNILINTPAFVLCLLLCFNMLPTRQDSASKMVKMFGGIGLAFLVGIGASLAIGGSLFGTLYPQVLETATLNLNPTRYPTYLTDNISLLNIFLSNAIIFLGTIATLFYFNFAQKPSGLLKNFREKFVDFWIGMGRLIIMITLGALFANIAMSRLTLLISRIQFLMEIKQRLPMLFGG